jgi:hypothetical protein
MFVQEQCRVFYTVGNTSADFISVEDAVYAMNVCGISSNVTLSLLNGTYDRLSFWV